VRPDLSFFFFAKRGFSKKRLFFPFRQKHPSLCGTATGLLLDALPPPGSNSPYCFLPFGSRTLSILASLLSALPQLVAFLHEKVSFGTVKSRPWPDRGFERPAPGSFLLPHPPPWSVETGLFVSARSCVFTFLTQSWPLSLRADLFRRSGTPSGFGSPRPYPCSMRNTDPFLQRTGAPFAAGPFADQRPAAEIEHGTTSFFSRTRSSFGRGVGHHRAPVLHFSPRRTPLYACR